MKKATAIAPANIAFIKYWGQQDQKLILPFSDTISMNLSDCFTTTTVAFDTAFTEDMVEIQYYGGKRERIEGSQYERVMNHVNRFRKLMSISDHVRVVSQNTFPQGAGIASSASAFAALTMALAEASGWEGTKRELSVLTRLAGSGSACRSIGDGFTLWHKGTNSETSYSECLYPSDYWPLVDIVAVVDAQEKQTGSADGHKIATTSPLFASRLQELPGRIKRVKQALATKDMALLGNTIEEEAISLHAVCMTSIPGIFYWNGATLEVMRSLQQWREEGIEGYFTMDAGPNVHVICEEAHCESLKEKLSLVQGVRELFINRPCQGAHLSNSHLL